MAIETLSDLNAQSCCCTLTPCPVPVMDCESVTLAVCGYSLPTHASLTTEEECLRFRTRTDGEVRARHTSGGGETYDNDETNIEVRESYRPTPATCNTRYVSGFHDFREAYTLDSPAEDWVYREITTAGSDAVYAGTVTYTDNIDPGNSYSDPAAGGVTLFWTTDNTWSYAGYTYTIDTGDGVTYDTYIQTVAFSDLITGADMIAELDAYLASLAGIYPDAGCAASFTCDDATKARIRFQIPNEWSDQVTGLTVPFTGNYFLITFDVLTTPDGWYDGWGGADRSYLADQTLLWTGPGTPIPDPIIVADVVTNQAAIDAATDTWFTAWFELAPPGEPGTREIVNIRYVCRENWRYGVIPDVTGTAANLANDYPLNQQFQTARHSPNTPLL